mgnify:CR=1 FL=1
MAKRIESTPKADGFRMPGEFEEQKQIWMLWPERPDNWRNGAKPAQKVFAEVAKAIAQFEPVTVCVSPAQYQYARYMLPTEVRVVEITSNDSWIRDCGPTFLVNGKGGLRAADWRFNAWGGEVDGLYPDYEQDDAFAEKFAEHYGAALYDAVPFVLEGGSIHCDGEGTALVTEACLLSAGRNPDLSKEQIEQKLKTYLGVEKVLWIPRGIYNDETNEHVDNVCAFIRPGEVVLAWTDNEADPQYALSKASLDALEQLTDAKGRKIIVHKLPVPAVPVCITEDEVAGFDFVEGEDMREAGERLAASYVNFYFSNDSVVVPAFGGENAASDTLAAEILAKLCPERKVVQIPARAILTGGGNIHCITQQIPKGVCL